MATQFDEQHAFTKPKALLLKMYSDRSYFERKYGSMAGVKDFKVLECETQGSKFRIKHSSLQPSDIPMPDFAKKLLGEHTQIIQQDSWDSATGTGRLDIEIKSAPIRVSCDMKVVDAPGGCAHQFKWTVSCSIPLVGGKVEKIIADDIKAKSRADSERSNALLQTWA